MNWRILCESAELAVQCLAAAQQIGLAAATEVDAEPLAAALRRLSAGDSIAMTCLTPPPLAALVELAEAAHGKADVVMALPVPHTDRAVTLDVASDLGIVAVSELRPLAAVLALLGRGAHHAYAASPRMLSALDRARLRHALTSSTKAAGQLVPVDGTRIGWCLSPSDEPCVLGETPHVALAMLALASTERGRDRIGASVEDVEPRAVLDVIFGPRRALSDPASKAALAPYGVPLPIEELCASPSRAAAEATRIGYPVRISLASPDLRVWDHPDLSVDMVDNAARVRDTFRQLMAAAEARVPGDASQGPDGNARVLGVMVTATSEAALLLGLRVTPLPRGRVAMQIGFADPHGRASNDSTTVVLPANANAIERALRRLAGSSLVLVANATERRARLDAIGDVLLRLAAFANDRRVEVESVEVRPLALLLDGTAEVREARVVVSDYFERSLAGSERRG
jgi:ATP-grasp domain